MKAVTAANVRNMHAEKLNIGILRRENTGKRRGSKQESGGVRFFSGILLCRLGMGGRGAAQSTAGWGCRLRQRGTFSALWGRMERAPALASRLQLPGAAPTPRGGILIRACERAGPILPTTPNPARA
jgi:hypothetical protein